MPIVFDVLLVILVVLVASLVALAVRRRLLQHSGGTFDCSVHLDRFLLGPGWVLGLGRYAGDRVEWFRFTSFSPRPRLSLWRRELEVVERRMPIGTEAVTIVEEGVILVLANRGRSVELAMSVAALTGFLSWLEAAPPGAHMDAS
jgi:Protein of unknown function (DUF2550)